ncbi:MAG: class I SAM-dependent methyltransferase [Leptospiraceae bacterium]|nr:class I SAM-dependent methyltransferase [Leptospiraceae bacterium]MCP5493291.1 class I SAM-dependent methyltransferase [Leptospiraceae bacterium]
MEAIVKENFDKPFSFYQSVILSILKNMEQGQLTVEFEDGSSLKIGNAKGQKAFIKLNNSKNFFKKLFYYGDIGFGESYVEGDWETNSISNIIRWILLNLEGASSVSGSKKKGWINFLGIVNKFQHFMNQNNVNGSRQNISYHYDLSNEFFQLFLDDTVSYSSGIFESKDATLKDAQIAKYERLCNQLELKPNDHVLEVGCGWGGFLEYAASKYHCKITGITISKEQYEFTTKRIRNTNLDHLVDVQLIDYRYASGKYNKIVSIEMLEAVGDKYLKTYFQKCSELLDQDGIFAIEVITSPDSRYKEFKKGVDWIQKHIFPGSLLPSIGAIQNAISQVSDMQIYNLYDIGIHYAKTLNLWFHNFNSNFERVQKLGFDEAFKRKWNYYLQYCEAAFYMRNISVLQITFVRPNNTSLFKEFHF